MRGQWWAFGDSATVNWDAACDTAANIGQFQSLSPTSPILSPADMVERVGGAIVGDATNVRPENLIERSRGWRRVGGTSLAQREAADRALVAAMRDHPNASVSQISRLVGSDKPCTCRRLAKLAEAGLTCGPMCVPSRHWHLTGKGAEIALSGRPLVDDLDRELLRVIAQSSSIVAASVARRVSACEMTARRRLRSLVERGLVSNGCGFGLTDAGRDLVGPAAEPWVKPLPAPDHHRRGDDSPFLGSMSIARFG